MDFVRLILIERAFPLRRRHLATRHVDAGQSERVPDAMQASGAQKARGAPFGRRGWGKNGNNRSRIDVRVGQGLSVIQVKDNTLWAHFETGRLDVEGRSAFEVYRVCSQCHRSYYQVLRYALQVTG